MAFTSTVQLLLAFAAAIAVVPAAALGDQASSQRNPVVPVAPVVVKAHSLERKAIEEKLKEFLAQKKGHALRGPNINTQIKLLAKELQHEGCNYNEEAGIDSFASRAAVQHFLDCVARVKDVAERTQTAATNRRDANARYGQATKVSLQRLNHAVEDINKLHESIKVEHEVATNHLKHQMAMIDSEVATIGAVNKAHKDAKGWDLTPKSEDESKDDSEE